MNRRPETEENQNVSQGRPSLQGYQDQPSAVSSDPLNPIPPYVPGEVPHVVHTIRGDEPVTRMVVPSAFNLNEAEEHISFPVGVYDVPDRLRDHWYVRSAGAMPLADAPPNHAMVRAAEDAALADKRAKEDAEIAARRAAEDKQLAEEALARRQAQGPRSVAPEVASRRAAEDQAREARRAEEDRMPPEARATADARRREDARIAAARAAEDRQQLL